MQSLVCLWIACALLTSDARILGAEPAAAKTSLVRQIDANTFQIGEVRLDAKERRVLIPATVNMTEGLVEYVLVSATGKLHESLFKTTAEPIHIHTATLLLLKAPPSTTTNSESRLRVSIDFGAGKVVSAESLIDNINPSIHIAPGLWRYNGSRMVEGTFIAQRDGSVVAIMADPDALIESGRVAVDDDDNWRPHKSDLPPPGTPVKVILTFEPAASDK